MGELSRWTVKVSKDTDISLRTFLAERGGKKGDLSKFVEDAVRKEILRATIRTVQDRNAHIPGEQLQAEIDQACAEARAEVLQGRKWWSD
jgi:hypothetical protein